MNRNFKKSPENQELNEYQNRIEQRIEYIKQKR